MFAGWENSGALFFSWPSPIKHFMQPSSLSSDKLGMPCKWWSPLIYHSAMECMMSVPIVVDWPLKWTSQSIRQSTCSLWANWIPFSCASHSYGHSSTTCMAMRIWKKKGPLKVVGTWWRKKWKFPKLEIVGHWSAANFLATIIFLFTSWCKSSHFKEGHSHKGSFILYMTHWNDDAVRVGIGRAVLNQMHQSYTAGGKCWYNWWTKPLQIGEFSFYQILRDWIQHSGEMHEARFSWAKCLHLTPYLQKKLLTQHFQVYSKQKRNLALTRKPTWQCQA